jgi:hypothetical protein
MRWITVGPKDQPGTSIVLEPPPRPAAASPDERRVIVEMMAKGTYAGINLPTTNLYGTLARLEASAAEVVQEPNRAAVRRPRLRRPRPGRQLGSPPTAELKPTSARGVVRSSTQR